MYRRRSRSRSIENLEVLNQDANNLTSIEIPLSYDVHEEAVDPNVISTTIDVDFLFEDIY